MGRSMSPGTLRGGATTTTTWRVSERVGRDTRSRARSGDGRRIRRHLRDVVRGASVRGALASERRVAPVAHRRGVAPALRRLVVRSRAAHARARKILETSRALDVHGGRTRRAVSALDGGAGGDGGDGARGGRAGGPEPKTRMVRGAPSGGFFCVCSRPRRANASRSTIEGVERWTRAPDQPSRRPSPPRCDPCCWGRRPGPGPAGARGARRAPTFPTGATANGGSVRRSGQTSGRWKRNSARSTRARRLA